ncbi:hypothetical protein Taro_029778, partial [Colocasia esculenta]|nr:hypothetical protein [Colocasia esculenta]
LQPEAGAPQNPSPSGLLLPSLSSSLAAAASPVGRISVEAPLGRDKWRKWKRKEGLESLERCGNIENRVHYGKGGNDFKVPKLGKGFGFPEKGTRGKETPDYLRAKGVPYNARCAAEQTQTVTRQSSTVTIAPIQGKEKSPELDDGGTGFPPRDDGDGGGGGGGGGPGWSGGFFFFGFLALLGLLQDKEREGDYRDQKKRYNRSY